MEPINNVLDPDEKILWGLIVDQNTPNERHFVITDRRIYRKSRNLSYSTFSEAPKAFLKLQNDVLIIERLGLKMFSAPSNKLLHIELRNSPREISYLIFDSLLPDHIKQIFKILGDSSNISRKYIADFYKANYELMKPFIINLNESTTLPRPIEHQYQPPPLPEPQIPPIFTPEKYQEPLQTPELYQEDSTSPQKSISSIPTQRIDQSILSPRGHNHIVEDFRHDYSYTSYNLKPSKKKELESPSFSANGKTTSQIIELNDNNLYYGSQCAYCQQKIANYEEKAYSCKECGAIFHENCLTNMMNEGFCYKCNRILVW